MARTLQKALPDLTYIALTILLIMPILALLLCLFETHHDDGFFSYRGQILHFHSLDAPGTATQHCIWLTIVFIHNVVLVHSLHVESSSLSAAAAAGAIIFVYKLLVMNNYTGLRDGLHGGSELVQLQHMVSVSLIPAPRCIVYGHWVCCLLCLQKMLCLVLPRVRMLVLPRVLRGT